MTPLPRFCHDYVCPYRGTYEFPVLSRFVRIQPAGLYAPRI